jgi:hypothetical protein
VVLIEAESEGTETRRSRKEREWLEMVKVNLIAGWKLETSSSSLCKLDLFCPCGQAREELAREDEAEDKRAGIIAGIKKERK